MARRLMILGVVMAVIGLGFALAGVYGVTQVNAGYEALGRFSAAQNVTLNYNDEGKLVDRGTTEGADAIMALLKNDWGYAVKASELDPNDPLVNTASEYMYQMATIAYHVMHGTQTIELAKDVEYNGQTFKAGTYDFEVNGRYWTGFDRQHPIEGPARERAWSGTAHGLIAELGVGTVTASTLQLGMGVSGMIMGLGLAFLVLGAGIVWVSRAVLADERIAETLAPAGVGGRTVTSPA